MDVKVRFLAPALAALAVCAPPAGAAPGDLDASFSGDGRVSTLTSPDTFVARGVAVQPDGRIVVAGYSCDDATCGPTGDSSFRLVRYTPDGGLDTDFGAGGMVTTAVGPGRSQAFDVVVRPDGHIVAGGVASADMADPGLVRARRLPAERARSTRSSATGAASRVITRVGSGLRRDLRPRAGARATGSSRSGRRRPPGATASRSRATTAAACPTRLRRRRDACRADARRPTRTAPRAPSCPTGASSRSAPRARPPRSRACASAACRSTPAAARARRGSARSATPTPSPTPPPRWPTGACCRRASRPSARATRRWRSCARARRASSTARGTATASRSPAPVTPRWRRTCCSTPRAARSPPATPAPAPRTSSRSRASTAPARWTRASAAGLVLTSFPGATVARATALARQADGKLVVAGIACASGSGPQCAGGTARLALARYAVTPGPGSGRAGGRHAARQRGQAAHRAVRLAAVAPARAPRPRARARPLPAGHALPRQADAAPPADGQRSLLLGSRTASIPARRARTIMVKVRRKRLGSRRRRARADGVRRPRRDRRAAPGRQAGHAAAGLSGVSPPPA